MFDRSAAETFLSTLWPLDVPEGEVLVISGQIPGSPVVNGVAVDIETALDHARSGVEVGAHVWVNVATRPAGITGRGGARDCVTVPALWLDLDVAEGAPEGVHRGAMFATYQEALDVLDRWPLPPTVIVATGWGLSAWWVLDEPTEADAVAPLFDAMRSTAARLSDGRCDPSVFDVARMMRLPGTMNVKVPGTAKPVTTFRWRSAARYSLGELADALDAPEPLPQPARPVGGSPGHLGRPGDDYNATTSTEEVVALLVAHGATEVERSTVEGRQVVKVARPGKDGRSGHSATIGWVGEGITYVFSSGWEGLPPGTYTPFRLRAFLDHDGDFTATARQLAGEGYGERLGELDKLPELDSIHVARSFVATYAGRIISASGMGWLVWNGAQWQLDNSGALGRLAQDYALALMATARREAETMEAKAGRDLVKLARSFTERRARLNFVADAADLTGVEADTLDADPCLLNCRNGVVDLRTGVLGPHDPDLRLTRIAAADYVPGARSADWDKALSGVGDDVGNYLRVALGLSSTGQSVADLLFVATGTGGNGKTTLIGSVAHALGTYAATVPAKLFTSDGQRETQLLMPLRGARMALAAESGEDHYLNMERLKALTGGDRLTDRYLYSRTFATWEPTHTLWLMTNHRPRVRNTDEGTWRRLQLVPFHASFIRPEERDVGLRGRLHADLANRTAILAWLVDGAREWLATNALPPSTTVSAATVNWRDDEDGLATFIRDKGYEVTGKEEHWIGAAVLYSAYRDWVMESGLRPLGAPNFNRELERYANRLRVAGGPTFWQHKAPAGIRWVGVRQGDPFASYRLPEAGTVAWAPEPVEEPERPESVDNSAEEGDGLPW